MKRFIALIFLYTLSSLAVCQNYIPTNAYKLKHLVISEVDAYFPSIPDRSYIPALIEHESCISLKHSRCWSSTSQLKTPREQGVGLGQITRAYNSDGSLRFDSLTELRNKHRRALEEINWNNVKMRPDLQIRMIVLMTRDNFQKLYDIDDPYQRLTMSDVAYNGGMGGLQRERRLCSLTKGCNPAIWFENVEKYCLKSKKVLYANRSACDINRHHAHDVMNIKMPKYSRLQFMNL